MENEEKFWNNARTIKWFDEQPVPDYWVTFFGNKRKRMKKILDLGCGAGRNTQFLLELGYDVYACDLCNGMVEATRKRLRKIGLNKALGKKRVIKASMLNLPYKNSFFDAVLSNGVFHNVASLKEIELAIEETARVLKKDGCLCFNLFSSQYIDPSLKRISDRVYLTKERLSMVLISRAEFICLCEKRGLVSKGEIIEYEREVSTGKRSIMRGILRKIVNK
jgi:ubiquinone/menaquinone biosynthesis C-methylase UbiE